MFFWKKEAEKKQVKKTEQDYQPSHGAMAVSEWVQSTPFFQGLKSPKDERTPALYWQSALNYLRSDLLFLFNDPVTGLIMFVVFLDMISPYDGRGTVQDYLRTVHAYWKMGYGGTVPTKYWYKVVTNLAPYYFQTLGQTKKRVGVSDLVDFYLYKLGAL